MKNYKDYLYPLSEGVKALVVMAADNEYGEHLKGLKIKPLITGVGPINAASELTFALSQLAHSRPPCRPDVIINLGSAGSANLDQGSVYRVSGSSYRDMDASAFGFPVGKTPFSPHPEFVESPPIMPEFPQASCSTGADVVKDHSVTGADMADMEYASFAQVAMNFGIPLIGFKGISDGKEPLSGKIEEWTQLLPRIDKNLAEAVVSLKNGLQQGTVTKKGLCAMPAHWSSDLASMRTQIKRDGV